MDLVGVQLPCCAPPGTSGVAITRSVASTSSNQREESPRRPRSSVIEIGRRPPRAEAACGSVSSTSLKIMGRLSRHAASARVADHRIRSARRAGTRRAHNVLELSCGPAGGRGVAPWTKVPDRADVALGGAVSSSSLFGAARHKRRNDDAKRGGVRSRTDEKVGRTARGAPAVRLREGLRAWKRRMARAAPRFAQDRRCRFWRAASAREAGKRSGPLDTRGEACAERLATNPRAQEGGRRSRPTEGARRCSVALLGGAIGTVTFRVVRLIVRTRVECDL